MSGPLPAARGLSAAELGAVLAALQPLLGSTVLDVVSLGVAPATDDLLVVLQLPSGGKAFVHVAPGGPRARITTTTRRFPKSSFRRCAATDLLQRELLSATLHHLGQPPGERRCAFHFRTARGERRLVVELFGSRGLWALLDAEGHVMALPRDVTTAVRTLVVGAPYAPPPPADGAPTAETGCRFAAPILDTVDDHYTRLDVLAEARRDHDVLLRAVQRALHRANAKAQGIGALLADEGRPARLREQADMMLAYAHTVTRGAGVLTFFDPSSGEPRTIELDPSKPIVAQAQTIYEKARRLDDGRVIAEQRHAAAMAAVTALELVLADLHGISTDAADAAARLEPVRASLQRLGVDVTPRTSAAPARAGSTGRRQTRPTRTENYRHFVSAEGYPILVGRDNEQNDRLTMHTAKGNDLWLHVGGGRPGSHVVVRLPKQKTASLETLLDAALLAVHFSKARNEPRIDVIYTQRKHVRKPKGLPAGAVVPSQTKTITSLLDEARLQRLLDSAAGDDPS